MDNLSLVHGLWEHHIRKWVTREQESWQTMEDVFKSIRCVTMMEERSKAYHQHEYESVPPVSVERVHKIRVPNRYVKSRTSLPSGTYSNTQNNPRNSSTFRNVHKSPSSQYSRDHKRQQYNYTPTNLKCYYCKGDNCLKNCDKFSRDKSKYKLKSADMFKKCKDKIMQHANNEKNTMNKAAYTTA